MRTYRLLWFMLVFFLYAVPMHAQEQNASTQDSIVYVTKTGKKYHLDGCSSLRQSKIPITLTEAKKKYSPCLNCFPQVPKEDAVEQTTKKNTGSVTVYITKTGSKYHRSGCRYLSRSKIAIDLDEAKKYYSPCKVCRPPS